MKEQRNSRSVLELLIQDCGESETQDLKLPDPQRELCVGFLRECLGDGIVQPALPLVDRQQMQKSARQSKKRT